MLVCLPGPVAAQALRTHRFRRAPLERLLLAPLPLAPVQMMVKVRFLTIQSAARRNALASMENIDRARYVLSL